MLNLHNGDCLDVLKGMESDSIDAIVTDPPYGISVTGEKWDKELPSREIWRECLRVLKPGGHLMAFASGPRYHLLAAMLTGEGFEIVNLMAWLYSSGMPRGTKLSKEFDRTDGIPQPDDFFREYLREGIKRSPYRIVDLERMCGTVGMFSHYLGRSQSAFPTLEKWKIIKEALKLDARYDALLEEIERRREAFRMAKEGARKSLHFPHLQKTFERHVPVSELAKKWEGWEHGGMALRPCLEPICLVRKPPLRPVRENVKKYGVGAFNIEGCKLEGSDGRRRVPSNVMHDGSEPVVERLQEAAKNGPVVLDEFTFGAGDEFFFVPKPGQKEREGNNHPTIKPVALMARLVRLVTPPGGVCLDPFMGSGTTGVACRREGMGFIGIEREESYFSIARERIEGGNNDSETHLCTEKEAS